MAEYNLLYQDLKKRLKILNLLNESDKNIDPSIKLEKSNIIDSLLKNLEYRHEEEQPLSEIELAVINLEKE